MIKEEAAAKRARISSLQIPDTPTESERRKILARSESQWNEENQTKEWKEALAHYNNERNRAAVRDTEYGRREAYQGTIQRYKARNAHKPTPPHKPVPKERKAAENKGYSAKIKAIKLMTGLQRSD
ncbi:unnamed protein product [Sympodiomycopsis kandeliae]